MRSIQGRARRTAMIAVALAAVTLSACGSRSASRSATTGATGTTSGVSSNGTSTTDVVPGTTTRSGSTTSTAPAPPASGTRSVPAALGGREWTVLPTRRRVVALTFDAGANADGVASILATLTRAHIPATMFLTGDFVEQFKTASRQIAAAGMRVADHSVSHPYFTKLTDAQIRHQVLSARDEIVSVTGRDPQPWFRFPYGDRSSHTIAVVNSVGFVPVGWTVDTLGWKGTSGGVTVHTVVGRVLSHLQPGEIVLMHCGSNPTDHSTLDAAALATVITELRSRGYSFVTVDALLAGG